MPTQAPKETYGTQADAAATPAPDDATRLHQMRDRLASLSDEARGMRSQVPREFEPDVDRIQQQMQLLGERLSELSGGAQCPAMPAAAGDAAQAPGRDAGEAPRAAPDEVILLGGPGQSDNPWDEESATALTRFYEAGEGYAGTPGARAQGPAPQASAAAAGCPMLPASWLQAPADTKPSRSQGMLAVEPAWLDQRFADIARRIEQSLAEMRPESSLLTIGNRFDQLEARMGSALRGVATRADIEQMRVAEAQIEEISTQLDQLRRSLARLDSIDAQLGTLAQQLTNSADPTRLSAIDAQLGRIAEQLSNERLADIFSQSVGRSIDIESLAAATAQKTAARLADPATREAHSRDIGEVRGMLESLINERRHSDENNASMLDTMQQAIIRVLDRIDALELAQQHVAGPAPASEPVQAPPAVAASARADADRAPGNSQPAPAQPSYYEAPFFTPAREESPTAPSPQSPFAAAPFDLDAAFASDRDTAAEETPANAPPQRAIDTLRHDFIADAHRAKLKAASKRDAAGDPPPARVGEFWANLEKSASAPPKPRRSIFRSPRVLMTILVLLGMIPAAVFFMPRMPANDDAFPAAESMVPPEGTPGTGIGAATESAPATPASNGAQAPAAPLDPMPSKQSQTLAPDPQPRTERYEDVGAPTPDRHAGPRRYGIASRQHRDGCHRRVGGPAARPEPKRQPHGVRARRPAGARDDGLPDAGQRRAPQRHGGPRRLPGRLGQAACAAAGSRRALLAASRRGAGRSLGPVRGGGPPRPGQRRHRPGSQGGCPVVSAGRDQRLRHGPVPPRHAL